MSQLDDLIREVNKLRIEVSALKARQRVTWIQKTAAPSIGTWRLGDVVWNSEPDAGMYVGWVCTQAGTPGVWAPFGGASAQAQYTPLWNASVSTPDIGDGVLYGQYLRFGKMCFATIYFSFGSTTNPGSGDWVFTLPFPVDGYEYAGSVYTLDNLTSFYCDVCRAPATGVALYLVRSGTGNYYTGSVPFTWAAGDTFTATITYATQ